MKPSLHHIIEKWNKRRVNIPQEEILFILNQIGFRSEYSEALIEDWVELFPFIDFVVNCEKKEDIAIMFPVKCPAGIRNRVLEFWDEVQEIKSLQKQVA